MTVFAGLWDVHVAVAQLGSYGPVCNGLRSIQWCRQMSIGLATGMAVDNSGKTYVASGSTVMALDPAGTTLYQTQFSGQVAFLAAGANGTLWVLAGAFGGTMYLLDGQGHPTGVNLNLNNITVEAMVSDNAGYLYLDEVPLDSFNHSIAKLTPAGVGVGVFPLSAYGSVTALAADATGAVYVAGVPVTAFPATPGAYQTTVPALTNPTLGITEAFVLKIAPAMDHVVYATLIYEGQLFGGVITPSAMAVDSLGNAYVGGYFWNAVGLPNFPAAPIGLPVDPNAGSAYVLKLNPQGTGAVWCAGLGSGDLNGLAVLADGRVRALMTVRLMAAPDGEEALFTISADGSAIESSNFLGNVLQPSFLAAVPPGVSAPAQILTAVSSARIPVIFNDQAASPIVLNFTDPPPSADLSLTLSLRVPVVSDNSTVDILATVHNAGPANAEGVQVVAVENGIDADRLECFPGGIAVCNPQGALIPNLPAGATMSFEFIYSSSCQPGPTCAESVAGGLYALTSDPNLTNNRTTLPITFVPGFPATLAVARNMKYYRSDAPEFYGYYPELNSGVSPPAPNTADPFLTFFVPFQTYQGNTWYFDSWEDGSRDNPRTIDASSGVPLSMVGLILRPARPIGVDPASLDLVALTGASPAAQSVTLYGVAEGGAWSIGQPAAAWLTLTAATNEDGSATVTGMANVTGLAPGYYTTTFPVTYGTSASSSTLDIPASLRIMADPPAISSGGVVSAASYQGGVIAPNEIIDIFGVGLGPPQLVTANVPQAGSLPTRLAGTSVMIGGAPAQLLYVQNNSIAAISINGTSPSPLTVQVTLGGTETATVTLPAAPDGPNVNGTSFAPALFTADSTGKGTLAAVNADGTINSPSNPAKRGTMVLLYGTGFYERSGFGCPDSFGSLLLESTPPVEAFVGGQPAYVLYSGSVLGLTCALQQFNVVIPDGSATGPAVPVQLGMAFAGEFPTVPYTWYTSQAGTTLAIQ